MARAPPCRRIRPTSLPPLARCPLLQEGEIVCKLGGRVQLEITRSAKPISVGLLASLRAVAVLFTCFVGPCGLLSVGGARGAGGSAMHLVVCRLRLPVLRVGWCSLRWQCRGEVVGPCWLLLLGSVIDGCGLSWSSQVELASCRCLLVVGGCWLPWVVWRWRHSVAALRQWVSRLKIDFKMRVTSSWTPLGLKVPGEKIRATGTPLPPPRCRRGILAALPAPRRAGGAMGQLSSVDKFGGTTCSSPIRN